MSPKYSLTKTDLIKATRNFVICFFGVLITAGGTELCNQLQLLSQQIDFGIYQGLAIAICASGTDLIRRYVTDYSKYIAEKKD